MQRQLSRLGALRMGPVLVPTRGPEQAGAQLAPGPTPLRPMRHHPHSSQQNLAALALPATPPSAQQVRMYTHV